MPDPFSLAASSFAVVGVVDVVVKASIECCLFLSAIKGAPEGIRMLKIRIEENKALSEAFITHLKLPSISIASTTSRMEPSLKLFEKSVKSFHRELTALKILEARYKGTSKLWSAVKYVFDEKKLNKCLVSLENAKSMLSAALQLIEGVRCDARQDVIEDELKQNSSQMMMASAKLQQDVTSIIQNQDTEVRIQKECVARSAQQTRMISLLRREVRDGISFNKTQHIKTRAKMAEGQQLVIDTITSRLTDLEVKEAKLIRRTRESREYHCISNSRKEVFDLLGYMKTPFERAVVMAVAQSMDVCWLQKEFVELLESASQENATLCRRTTATSVDHWTYSTVPHRDWKTHGRLLPSQVDENETTDSDFPLSHRPPENRELLSSKVISYASFIGELYLQVLSSLDKEDSTNIFKEARAMFIPAVGFCATSLAIRFVQIFQHCTKPRFYTHLNALRVNESTNAHWRIIAKGTLEEIDLEFRRGSLSPYDQIRAGWMICFRLAGVHFRADLLRYLKCQGFCISSVNGEDDVFIGAWASVQVADLDDRSETSIGEILELIAEPSIEGLAAANCALLHTTCLVPIREITKRRYRVIMTMLTFLKRKGYDLDMTDANGRSPLLTHISGRGAAGLIIARALLDLGANPHSVDRYGNNAMQLAMMSNVAWNRRDVGPMVQGMREFPEILLGKLELLVKAGVSLDHENHRGDTVFSIAEEYHCLDVFRKAMELNSKLSEYMTENDASQ